MKGPVPVLHSPMAPLPGPDGGGGDSQVEVTFGSPCAWCPSLSVAAVAASAGGVWVAMPPQPGDASQLTALHVSVESAGDVGLRHGHSANTSSAMAIIQHVCDPHPSLVP